MPSGPKYFSRRPNSKLLERQLQESKWPCKKTLSCLSFKLVLVQESLLRLNLPKEIEKNKVDDCVDDTDNHIEHADKEISICMVVMTYEYGKKLL